MSLRTRNLAALLAASACATGAPPPPPAAPDPLPPGDGRLRVSLAWSAAADLDLYVTDPSQETVYYANTPVASGGRLVRDVRCENRPEGGAVETIEWQAPASGRYRIGVDCPERCNGEGPVPFRIVAEAPGARRDVEGDVAPRVFSPLVLEIEVGEGTLRFRHSGGSRNPDVAPGASRGVETGPRRSPG